MRKLTIAALAAVFLSGCTAVVPAAKQAMDATGKTLAEQVDAYCQLDALDRQYLRAKLKTYTAPAGNALRITCGIDKARGE